MENNKFIEVADQEVRAALNRLIGAMEHPGPALGAIGETWLGNTKGRFDRETGPDGQRWHPNAPSTLLRYLAGRTSNWKKDGSLSAKGAERLGAKKILQGRSGDLRNTLFWTTGEDFVALGSPMIYAATQHFGAKQGEFGRTKRNQPIPWGNIPSRPIFGVSEEDRGDILGIVNDFLSASVGKNGK